mmetsp:Transcript_2606/g.4804  ORF Transcript_2606/g.4804 Transcript_2606/m.4804 type:complete len:304 (+) Transcript_2606:395-1306(+)
MVVFTRDTTAGQQITLQGKVIIVTGGGGGLGKKVAEGAANLGAAVVIADRVVEAGEKVVQSINGSDASASTFQRAIFCEFDLSDVESCAALVRKTVDTFGRVDGLVQCAAITLRNEWEDIAKLADPMFKINTIGPMELMKECGRSMREMVRHRRSFVSWFGTASTSFHGSKSPSRPRPLTFFCLFFANQGEWRCRGQRDFRVRARGTLRLVSVLGFQGGHCLGNQELCRIRTALQCSCQLCPARMDGNRPRNHCPCERLERPRLALRCRCLAGSRENSTSSTMCKSMSFLAFRSSHHDHGTSY